MGSGYVMLVNTFASLLICYIESICCDANQQIWRISFKDVLLDTKQRYQQSVLYTNLKDTVHCKFGHLSNIILMLLVNLFRLQERTLNLNRNYLVQSCHFILKRPVRTHFNAKRL